MTLQPLDLRELIRMNKLIRPALRAEEFERWWFESSPQQRRNLCWTLLECALQAGINEDIQREALSSSQVSGDDPAIRRAIPATSGPPGYEFALLLRWFLDADSQYILPLFRFAYHLFAIAEARVFRQETTQHCNHWWHRDLLDARVEADLLSDPKFYETSMATDARIKG